MKDKLRGARNPNSIEKIKQDMALSFGIICWKPVVQNITWDPDIYI